MTKEEIISYLQAKQALTVDVQNARHDLSIARENFELLKRNYKNYFILLFVAGIVVPILMGFSTEFNWGIYGVWLLVWWIVLIALIILRISQGIQAKSKISAASQNLDHERNKPDYLSGMSGFPNKFYSYWTIDRLITLVEDTRATTLQEAYNIAENQDFQNDQLALQQQNLQVNRTTATMASIGAAASVYNALKK